MEINIQFDKKEHKLNTYFSLASSLNFLFILAINFQNKTFIETIFEQNSNLMKSFFESLKHSLLFSEQYEIVKILLNFYTAQFLTLFSDLGLSELYGLMKEKLMKFMLNNFDFKKFASKEYKNLIKHILLFEFDLKSNFEKTDICSPEDKQLGKFIDNNIFGSCFTFVPVSHQNNVLSREASILI